MTNLFEDSKIREFYHFLDPHNFVAWNNGLLVGSFTSSCDNSNPLSFHPNPSHQNFLSPFQSNMLHNYTADYNLEISRQTYFANYPSRLQATFLLEDLHNAKTYATYHPEHVKYRILTKVQTNGSYVYSEHDSGWVDFLRLLGYPDMNTNEQVGKSYWTGVNVSECELQSRGKSWSQHHIREILYCGRIDFLEKDRLLEIYNKPPI